VYKYYLTVQTHYGRPNIKLSQIPEHCGCSKLSNNTLTQLLVKHFHNTKNYCLFYNITNILTLSLVQQCLKYLEKRHLTVWTMTY